MFAEEMREYVCVMDMDHGGYGIHRLQGTEARGSSVMVVETLSSKGSTSFQVGQLKKRECIDHSQ
jgi:hypothetical protein